MRRLVEWAVKVKITQISRAKTLNWGIVATTLCLLLTLSVTSVWAQEIDDNLIQAIVMVESSGRPDAVSSAGAIGLMQIMPIVLKEWNVQPFLCFATKQSGETTRVPPQYKFTDLYDPFVNVQIGTWYLKRIKSHYLKDVMYEFDNAEREDWPLKDRHFLMCGLDYYYLFKYHLTAKEVKLCLILAAYNMGPTRLKKLEYQWWRIEETKNYVKKVMRLYKEAK